MTMNGAEMMEAIAELGYRMTGPRRLVVEAVGERRGGFSAEQIARDVPSVGRATVYRTLRLLQEAGAVCKLALPDGAPMYTAAQVGRHHHHAVCVHCNRVEAFRASTIERAIRELSMDVPGRITGHRVEVYVTCSACDRAAARSSRG